MQQQATAWDVLSHGDAIRARVARDHSTVAAVAIDAGFSEPAAAKAAWLAGAYDAGVRRRLGRRVLSKLSSMHLEVVAKAPTDVREALLERAARDGLAARDLRALVRAEAARSAPVTTRQKLEESTRAMETYAGFDDRALGLLVNGPNGDAVVRAATAGHILAARISHLTPTP